MKVCVLNFSGNVGKSTIAAHLLQPRLNAQVFSVESLNVDASSDGVEVASQLPLPRTTPTERLELVEPLRAALSESGRDNQNEQR